MQDRVADQTVQVERVKLLDVLGEFPEEVKKAGVVHVKRLTCKSSTRSACPAWEPRREAHCRREAKEGARG